MPDSHVFKRWFNKCTTSNTNVNVFRFVYAVDSAPGHDYWVPSDQYTDITYGASGDTYTAPANGWVYVECTTSSTNAYILTEVIISAESSKIYGNGATNITEDLLRKEMHRANKLLKRKLKLISIIDSQKDTIARDISSIARLETKYELISKSLAKVAVFAIFALFSLLAISRWLH
jgi:hypothetical protein